MGRALNSNCHVDYVCLAWFCINNHATSWASRRSHPHAKSRVVHQNQMISTKSKKLPCFYLNKNLSEYHSIGHPTKTKHKKYIFCPPPHFTDSIHFFMDNLPYPRYVCKQPAQKLHEAFKFVVRPPALKCLVPPPSL